MRPAKMRGVEVPLFVGAEELIVTADVQLPVVVAGPSLRGGEVVITGVRVDGPPGNRPAWSGTLSDVDEDRAKDALLEEAAYRDMRAAEGDR
jgi:hypothetical protein